LVNEEANVIEILKLEFMLEKKNTLKVDSNLDLYSEASKGCNSLYNISNFWYNSWIPVNNMSYFHIDYKICE